MASEQAVAEKQAAVEAAGRTVVVAEEQTVAAGE